MSAWAAEFKAKGDIAGVHLCAVVEEEMQRHKSGDRCGATPSFYLALVVARHADGADHELAHLFLPTIQEMFSDARHRNMLQDLKREAGIE